MFEMTMVLMATAVLGMIAYEFTMTLRGREWGENASSFFQSYLRIFLILSDFWYNKAHIKKSKNRLILQ